MPDPLPARATRAILDRLEGQHPNADTELAYRTAFELLIATILSAQSTDARVNEVTPALFARFPDAAHLAEAEPGRGGTPDRLDGLLQAEGAVDHHHVAPAGRTARRRSACRDGRAHGADRRRPQDRQRRAGACAGHPGLPRRSARAARGQPPGDRGRRRSGIGGSGTLREASERAVDARQRHADSPRPARLPAHAGLRSVRGQHAVPLLHGAWRHADRAGARHASARRKPATKSKRVTKKPARPRR